jgi:hypothetical protein
MGADGLAVAEEVVDGGRGGVEVDDGWARVEHTAPVDWSAAVETREAAVTGNGCEGRAQDSGCVVAGERERIITEVSEERLVKDDDGADAELVEGACLGGSLLAQETRQNGEAARLKGVRVGTGLDQRTEGERPDELALGVSGPLVWWESF